MFLLERVSLCQGWPCGGVPLSGVALWGGGGGGGGYIVCIQYVPSTKLEAAHARGDC